jgi:two-component system, NtrC family, sensor kinase
MKGKIKITKAKLPPARRGLAAAVKPRVRVAPPARAPAAAEAAETSGLKRSAAETLAFLLREMQRTTGALLIVPPEEGESALLVKQDPDLAWKDLLEPGLGALYRVASQILESGTEAPADAGLGLAAAIPLTVRSVRIGALLIAGPLFSLEETVRLREQAGIAARSLRISLSYQNLRTADKELAALHMIAAILTSDLELDEIQKAMVAGIRQILDCDMGCLALANDRGDRISKKVLGDGPEWIFQSNQKLEGDIVEECLRSTQPMRVDNPSARPDLRAFLEQSLNVASRSFLCAPLLAGEQPIGVVEMINKRGGPFTPYDQELLNLLATSMGDAIHNKRLIQQLKVVNTDLQANQAELLNSRNTLRALFDNIPASIYIVDRAYMLRAVNWSRAQRVQTRPNQLVTRCCYEALFGRLDPCPGCRVGETLTRGESTRRSSRRKEAGDEERDWEIGTYPIFDEAGQVHQAIVLEEDMTERIRLEASLAQSEKLAAVGQLAAGVAHEINNPLTAVIANAQLLQRSLPPDSDLQESVDLIVIAGGRAAQVVRNLLDFSRKEQYRFEPTDVNETIRKALGLVQHEILSRSITLTFAPDDGIPRLLASGDHLQGLWLNLLLNALDAFEGAPGEIRITTRYQDTAIQILFEDNGRGIPAEYLPRIFEPFFTTKSPGRGTGLGLSVCHQIVKQHGGTILVESKTGKGTLFTVVLPVTPHSR